MDSNYLMLNNDKTQLLLVGADSNSSRPPIRVGSTLVSPGSSVDVLGVSFDHRLFLPPHGGKPPDQYYK